MKKKMNCWQMFHLKMCEFFFVGIFFQHPSQIQKGKNDTDFNCLLQKLSSLQECDKIDFSPVNRSNEMKINLNKTRATINDRKNVLFLTKIGICFHW